MTVSVPPALLLIVQAGGKRRASDVRTNVIRFKTSSYPLLIKVFPNNTIESHTIITTNAAPHLISSRSIAPAILFVTDACAVEVPDILGSATLADELFGVTGVSFFTKVVLLACLVAHQQCLVALQAPPMVLWIELPRLVLVA